MFKSKSNYISQFTLLELVLAMALLLVLVAMLMTAGNSITATWGRILEERQRFAEVLKLDAALDGILANVVPFHWPIEEGEPPVLIFHGESDQIDFVYRHRLNSAEDGTLRFCRLAVIEDALVAQYQNRPLLDQDYPENIRDSVLAEGVDRIELLYAGWNADTGIEWVQEWNSDNEVEQIPLGIVIWVYWQDGRWECWLRRTAGNGFRERLGKGYVVNSFDR